MRRSNELRNAERLPVSKRSGMSLSPFFEDFWEPMRLFDDFFRRDYLPSMSMAEPQWLSPAIDVEETDSEYLVYADLPGVKKEDINVECSENQLTITAERKYESVEGRKRDRQERFYGKYQRSFTLPQGIRADNIQADFSNGELVVHVPKGEESKARKIEIGERSTSSVRH